MQENIQEAAQNAFGFAHLWASGDLVSHTVAYVLVAMSVASWYLILAKAWDHLDEPCRRVLLTMSLVTPRGDGLPFITATCGLEAPAVTHALQQLIRFCCVQLMIWNSLFVRQTASKQKTSPTSAI